MIRQNGRCPSILDWQQAYAVSGAALEWLSNIESEIEDHRVPALHMEFTALAFDFYRHGGGQGPKMICTAETERGLSQTSYFGPPRSESPWSIALLPG